MEYIAYIYALYHLYANEIHIGAGAAVGAAIGVLSTRRRKPRERDMR